MWNSLSKSLLIVSTTFINRKQIRRTVRSCMFRPKQSSSSHYIDAIVCLATGLQRLPISVPHRLTPSASSFNLKCPLFSSMSSSSCLRLLSRLAVTSILPSYLQWRVREAVRKPDVTNPVRLPSFYCM